MLNPVEKRLAYIGRDWFAYRNESGKPLLVWQSPASAAQLMAAFFESQKHPTAYATGDFFVVFDVPFGHGIQYSRDLKSAFAEQYAASLEDLSHQGEATDWAFSPADFPDSPEGLVAALGSFASHYAKRIGVFAAVLQPVSGADKPAFVSWLRRAANANFAERLRLVVIDATDAPLLASVSDEKGERIAVRELQLDSFDVAQETFAQEPVAGPAGVFRNQLTALIALVEKGSVDQVKSKARDALAFVQQQKWTDQEIVVRLLVGGALVKAARFDEAVAIYRASRQLAEQVHAAGHPAGHKLILQTWFGEAGALLAAGDDRAAADCYRQAAASARADQNLILAIEALRMAAFCHGRNGDREAALAYSQQALACGAQLRPEVRGMTTLPVAAMDYLRALDSASADAITRHKAELDQVLASHESQAEAHALAAGPHIDSQTAQRIEDDWAADDRRANDDVEHGLAHLLAKTDPAFQRAFAHARGLLGADWPLIGSVAIPAPPPVESPS